MSKIITIKITIPDGEERKIIRIENYLFGQGLEYEITDD